MSPESSSTRENLDIGLKYLLIDGVFSQVMGTLISGTFIIPLMILLGAQSIHISIYSAILALTTLSQIFSPKLSNTFKSSKKIAFNFSLIARTFLLCIGILVIVNEVQNLIILILIISIFYAISNISSGAFKYWMVDLVPKNIRGKYFAKRSSISLLIAGLIGLAVASYVDNFSHKKISTYGSIIFSASIFGLVGLIFLNKVPETKYYKLENISLKNFKTLVNDFRFRKHFQAIFSTYFAINLAMPLIIYYMLTKLELSITTTFTITLIGQIAMIIFLPKWGRLIDRYGVKPVLKVAIVLLGISFTMWTFTTLPNRHIFSIPIALITYTLIGLGIGGLNLSSSLIGFYLVKDRKNNNILPINEIFVALGSMCGALFGSLLIIPTNYMELSLTFNIYLREKITLYLLDLQGIDFIFVFASIALLIPISLFKRYKIDLEIDEEKNYYEIVIGFKRFLRNFRGQVVFVTRRRIGKINKYKKLKRIMSLNRTKIGLGAKKAINRNRVLK